jgi:tRNA (guanine-N7-)-methyltransferase
MVRRGWVEADEFSDLVVVRSPDEVKRLDVEQVFGNRNELEVDIGCGKGRFLIARASSYPQTNFLGVERQAGRVLRTAKKAVRLGLENVRLARVEACGGLAELLEPGSVATVYVFFPDPWPKRRHHRRRLINSDFMDLMHEKLRVGGLLHFASDHADYAKQVSGVFAGDERFEADEVFEPTEEERTDFELIFRGQSKPIWRYTVRKLA